MTFCTSSQTESWADNLRMNPLIDAIYTQGHFLDPADKSVSPFPDSIKRPEGEAIYHLIRQAKPQATLEVGMAWGLSSLFICQALKDNGSGHHTAVDPYELSAYRGSGVHNVQQAGLGEYLTLLSESSHFALPRLVQEKRQFEVMFIDGSHLFDDAFVDFFYANRLLPVGGYLIVDDLWMPAVRKMLAFVLNNLPYEIDESHLSPKPPLLQRHWQNLRYQTRQLLRGKWTRGVPSETRFHRWHNVNWTVLRKGEGPQRVWDHYSPF